MSGSQKEVPEVVGISDANLRFGAGTALVVVDVQNDFADPAGSLFVPGGDRVAAAVASLMRSAAADGSLVVCTQDWHPAVTPHFQEFGGRWPAHCVAGSWGAELHPSLPPAESVVRKGQGERDGYSGFGARDLGSGEVEPTGLGELLERAGVTRVVIVGLALDVCVRATAIDALALGLQTVVVSAATAAVDLQPGEGARTLAELRKAGAEVL
ncbi:MAG: isochorismatase family protein [Candidatus Dormiibacterota bacterium]